MIFKNTLPKEGVTLWVGVHPGKFGVHRQCRSGAGSYESIFTNVTFCEKQEIILRNSWRYGSATSAAAGPRRSPSESSGENPWKSFAF